MNNTPLALKLRPQKLDDIIGQNHLIGKNCLLSKIVISKTPINIIFYGYPGTGKSTIAIAMSKQMQLPYAIFNAANDKKEFLQQLIQNAKLSSLPYILIIEEIHRLNKDKQDILLQYLENGTITLFACTTENPYFSINPAIRSRCTIARLELIKPNQLYLWFKKININNKLQLNITNNSLKTISQHCNGDVRYAINIIDIIEKFYKNEKITIKLLKKILLSPSLLFASYGDEYYDLLSAFHKSIRGSDPDAAIYYLARLLTINDLTSICRRLIACAYEDIGLANPQLCSRVVIATNAVNVVGFPECKQILSDIVIEMCLSPKSNSGLMAINNALNDINNGKCYEIPKHLKDNNYHNHKSLGNIRYIYPHDFPNHWVKQNYLPQELFNAKYYNKSNNQNENILNKYLEDIKSK